MKPSATLFKLWIITLLSTLICTLSFSTLARADWAEDHPSSPLMNENYYRLKKALDYYSTLQMHSWPIIDVSGLQKSEASPLVSELRERMILTGDLARHEDTHSEIYDEGLQLAVKRFQWRHGLTADGVIGSRTLREMNVSPYERAEEIRRNMERWGALPAQLGQRFIFINIPEYRFDLVDNGKDVITMKVIVGKTDRPTPEFASTINQVELNPYWNVPPSIAKRDIIPKILSDRTYLDKMNIKVIQHHQSEVVFLDPNTINWEDAAENGFNFELRQEPGKNNALGLVKFDFPNAYDVYMHDTPAKQLFDKDIRNFSSGCIRLEKPFALLSYLLTGDPAWDLHHIAEALSSGVRTVIKVRPLKVYVIYATAWVDRDGILHFRRDPYGYNEDPNPDDFAPEALLGDPFALPLSFYA